MLRDIVHAVCFRYSEYSLVKRSRLEVLQAVQEKLSECEQWHTAYKVRASVSDMHLYLSVEMLPFVRPNLVSVELVAHWVSELGFFICLILEILCQIVTRLKKFYDHEVCYLYYKVICDYVCMHPYVSVSFVCHHKFLRMI